LDIRNSFERNAMARSAIDLLKSRRQQLFDAQRSNADYVSNGNSIEAVGGALVARCFDYQLIARPRPVALSGTGYLDEFDFTHISADGTACSLLLC